MTPIINWLLLAAALAWVPLAATPAATGTGESDMAQVVALLKSKRFQERGEAVDLLARDGGERARSLLEAYLAGHLYYLKQGGALVFAEREGRKYRISDALDGKALGLVKKRSLRKIKLNNRLRSRIRSALAVIDLRDPDPARRLAAVGQMLDRPDPGQAALLEPLLGQEHDPRVREVMEIVVALSRLTSDDPRQRTEAVELLSGNVHPAVRNALTRLQQETGDPALSRNIQRALENIEGKLQLYGFLENLFFGLSLGSVLVLAAIGLAITFGVMGVINMAHGELIMIGAYTTYVMQLLLPGSPGAAVLLSIPAAFLVSGLVGIAIERGVIRFLYGRSLETLLATFGISLILQQTVRSIFSPLNRSVET
ncbi:MAG TPA: urea ABC transporter permease subunit UrtB, partial [Sedimenticola sp.]|nr:urea ABC transporter permease subunit UrtB [Sedimenticola sp.]